MELSRLQKSKKNKLETVNLRYLHDYKKNRNQMILARNLAAERKRILLGILRKRQQDNEVRTVRAVDCCRQLVRKEIDQFFEEKELIVNGISAELLAKIVSRPIVTYQDLEQIIQSAQGIILKELSERFKCNVVWKLNKYNLDDGFSELFSQIRKFQQTKKRTVLISTFVEALARKALGDSFESLVNKFWAAKIIGQVDLAAMLLPELGVNSDLEIQEWKEEVIKRLGGFLAAIKVRLIQEINKQIADIFYKTHDARLNYTLEFRILRLEETIEQEIYATGLLEA